MNLDENDDLWHLLGKAKKPVVSPFFARNVMRQIRMGTPVRGGLFGWFSRGWALAGAAAMAVVLLAITLSPPVRIKQSPVKAVASAQKSYNASDYEVIHHLDELLALEENAIWLDNSSY